MIKKISIKTRFGWISAFENNGKLFKIKFGKQKKQKKSKILKNFKTSLLKYMSQKKILIFHIKWKVTLYKKKYGMR